MGKDLLICLHY